MSIKFKHSNLVRALLTAGIVEYHGLLKNLSHEASQGGKEAAWAIYPKNPYTRSRLRKAGMLFFFFAIAKKRWIVGQIAFDARIEPSLGLL